MIAERIALAAAMFPLGAVLLWLLLGEPGRDLARLARRVGRR